MYSIKESTIRRYAFQWIADADDEEYPSLYTDQAYAELEDAFESTRTDEDDEDFEGPVYTDEEYEELEGAFENY